MNTFLGADTAALREHAQRVVAGSGRLGELHATLTSTVDSVPWEGPDAEAFRADFASRVGGMLGSVRDELGGRAQDLRAEADEQDEVSDGDDGGGAGGGGTAGGGRDPLDGGLLDNPLTRVIETVKAIGTAGGKVYGAFKTGRSLVDLARAARTVGDAARSAEVFIRGSMIDEAAGFLGKLGTVGKFGGGALGVLGIVGGISDMISPPHDGWRGVGDRVAGGLSVVGGAGGLAVALGGAAMLGPVGLGVVAAAGVGAALWTAGNLIYDNREAIADFAGNAGETVKDFAGDVKDAAGGVKDFVGGLFG